MITLAVDTLNEAYMLVLSECEKEPKLKDNIVTVNTPTVPLHFTFDTTMGHKGAWVVMNDNIIVEEE
jgi:hypothetical protein